MTRPNENQHQIDQLTDILQQIAQITACHYACVLSRAHNSNVIDRLAEAAPRPLDPEQDERLFKLLRTHLHRMSRSSTPLTLTRPVAGSTLALLVPLHAADEVVGLVAVLTEDVPRLDALRLHIGYIQTILENIYLHSTMSVLVRTSTSDAERTQAAIINAVTDGVLLLGPSGRGARIIMVNTSFAHLFDLKNLDLTNYLLRDLIALLPVPEPVRDELTQKWLETSVHDPGSERGSFRMTHAEGYSMDIEWYGAPVLQQGRVMARLYILYNRTAEQTAQRLRSAFVSRVSHELRTPLTSISGFAEFILEAAGDDLPDLAREYTEIILSSARHLNRIFNDMIEISRADAGEIKLNRVYAHLPDIVIDTVARLELMHKQREQHMVMDIDDNAPPVIVDVDRISQVMTNLLSNAIKYSPQGGTIRILMRVVDEPDDLPASAPLDVTLPAILVSVIDEGDGLSVLDAERIFLPFVRTDHARMRKIEGAGLGLAVTRSLVELHRGRIWVEPGAGGQFLFTLPTAE